MQAQFHRIMAKILIIDDERAIRNTLKEILEFEGYEIDLAENGRVGVEKAKGGGYDLIYSDVKMPEMDGYEATLRIRKLPNRIRANIPIIAFTANAVSENRDRAFAVGMDGFLVKPVNTSRLLSCLAKLL